MNSVQPSAAPPPDTPSTAPPKPAKRLLDQFSLRMAGVLNLVGDVGLLATALNPQHGGKRDNARLLGGALYTLGGLNLAIFGSMSTKQREKQLSERTATFMQHQVGDLPVDSALGQVVNNNKPTDFLFRYPAQTTLVAYTAGAGAMLVSGVRKLSHGGGTTAMWYGISSLVCKIVALMVPEKTTNPDEEDLVRPASNPVTGVMDWIREKPLRLLGYGSLVTDSLLAVDSYKDFKSAKLAGETIGPKANAWKWAAATSATYLLADFMMAISHKDSRNSGEKFTPEQQQNIEQLAADSIARQAEPAQEKLIHKTATFLAKQGELQGSTDAIEKTLRKEVGDMKTKQSWTARTAEQENNPQESIHPTAH